MFSIAVNTNEKPYTDDKMIIQVDREYKIAIDRR